MLQSAGWPVNHKRVERLWRREGLKVPQRHPKRRRRWFNDGSCIRLRPTHRNHVWSYDFMQARTHDGRSFRLLTLLDEYTRECLAIVTGRRLKHESVMHCLTGLFTRRGMPEHMRSDNGSEFTATALRTWLQRLGVATLYITPGSHWGKGKTAILNRSKRNSGMMC